MPSYGILRVYPARDLQLLISICGVLDLKTKLVVPNQISPDGQAGRQGKAGRQASRQAGRQAGRKSWR